MDGTQESAIQPTDFPAGSLLREVFEAATPLVLHLTYSEKIILTPAGYRRLLGVKTYSDAVAKLMIDRIITPVILDQGQPTERSIFVLLASPEQVQLVTQGDGFAYPRLDRDMKPGGPAWLCGSIPWSRA
jgi:hypothetical protein